MKTSGCLSHSRPWEHKKYIRSDLNCKTPLFTSLYDVSTILAYSNSKFLVVINTKWILLCCLAFRSDLKLEHIIRYPLVSYAVKLLVKNPNSTTTLISPGEHLLLTSVLLSFGRILYPKRYWVLYWRFFEGEVKYFIGDFIFICLNNFLISSIYTFWKGNVVWTEKVFLRRQGSENYTMCIFDLLQIISSSSSMQFWPNWCFFLPKQTFLNFNIIWGNQWIERSKL